MTEAGVPAAVRLGESGLIGSVVTGVLHWVRPCTLLTATAWGWGVFRLAEVDGHPWADLQGTPFLVWAGQRTFYFRKESFLRT